MVYEDLKNKVAVVTAGGGAICGEIASGLAEQGARVAVLDIDDDAAARRADAIRSAGGEAIYARCDVLDRSSVESAIAEIVAKYGTVDILVNGAGGSRRETTTGPGLEFFDMAAEEIDAVMQLNYMSAVIPSQVVGRIFAEKGAGVVLNISSIASFRPLTRAIAYSNGKAATNSFTQWLAVHMAQNYSPRIRVNAIAPGFMITKQNRFLLIDEATGEMTERGRQVMAHVPMRRYGEPSEMVGAAIWLVSESAAFVTGAVIPIDGGLTAFAGV